MSPVDTLPDRGAQALRPTNLNGNDVDALGRMVMTLVTELWITRDRLAVVERILTEEGTLRVQAVDDYKPDEQFTQQLEAMRMVLSESILGAAMATTGLDIDSLREFGTLERTASG
jgi:hypothetical protein